MPVIEIDGIRFAEGPQVDVDLPNVVKDIKGSTFVGLDTDTEPDMNKRNNPFYGRVRKVCKMLVQLNASDERKMLSENPDYTPAETYHEAVVRPDGTATPLSVHKTNGTLYLRAHPLSVQSVRYLVDGVEVPKEVVEPYLKVKGEPTTERAITRANANAPYRLFKIVSVKAIRLYHAEVTF
jgi:hypothetical protein